MTKYKPLIWPIVAFIVYASCILATLWVVLTVIKVASQS